MKKSTLVAVAEVLWFVVWTFFVVCTENILCCMRNKIVTGM